MFWIMQNDFTLNHNYITCKFSVGLQSLMEKRIYILNDPQIRQKIRRIAYQILENNLSEGKVFIGGIGERGGNIASLIHKELENFVEIESEFFAISFDQEKENKVTLNIESSLLVNQTIIIVDDVLNTGRTLMDILLKVAQLKPKRIETCFLAQRNHRMFPVKGDYVGISLATTFQEHIYFDAANPDQMSVYLE